MHRSPVSYLLEATRGGGRISEQACADVVTELGRTSRAHRLVQRRRSHEHLANVAVLALVDVAGELRSGDLAEQLLVDTSVASRQVRLARPTVTTQGDR